MGLLQNISSRVFGTKSNAEINQKEKQELLRKCYFEVMEQRRVLSADPVIAAVTYLEGDAGQDTTPDHFEVTFEGGAETTQLTQFTINGDQDSSGDVTDGDMLFDVDDQSPGTGGHHEFIFDAANSQGVTESDIVSVSVSTDGLLLSVEVDNFEAGDVFAFTIDVDEVERFRLDRIASGVEFEGSMFTAQFVDQHHNFEARDVNIDATLTDGFVQPQFEGVFFDEYNEIFAEAENVTGGEIDLTRDNEEGQADRTAGSIDAFDLVPKPITISGTVFEDENLSWQQEADESGIGGVTIELQKLNEESGVYETVATTVTDANGFYEFGEDLALTPGNFQLVEVHPDGFLDVGAGAGSEGGTEQSDNVLTDINIPLGGTNATDYNFKEIRPASISGHVWHDENNDGVFDPNEDGIANVLIEVTRIGAKPGAVEDPFADTTPIQVRTDANGHWEVDALPPGVYQVVQIDESGSANDPLAPFIDGKDAIGNIDGVDNGNVSNDRFTNIVLCAGDEGVHYDFGEIMPADISGTVWHDRNNDGVIDPDEERISGVTIELFDKEGNLLAQTVTNSNGDYMFDNLFPGDYIVRQTQPEGFIDGKDVVGQIDGTEAGQLLHNDEFCVTLEAGDSGVNYDFGELLGAEIKGTVYHDRNNNGVQDEGEEGIEGTRIVLTDGEGNVIAETFTDENGDYCFEELPPGTYKVTEFQPEGYIDGIDSLGNVAGEFHGVAGNDMFCDIVLESGDQGGNYDFGEILPASIKGTVYVDTNNNGIQDEGEAGIEGTRIVLTDAEGNVIAETLTDADGNYCFEDLIPGTYKVTEIQPDGFFDGIDTLGEINGETHGVSENDMFCDIVLESGEVGEEFNFGETPAAEIHGRVWEDGPAFETEDGNLPEDFRSQRDGIFQEGTDTPIAGVRMQLFHVIDPVNNSNVPRAVTLGEVDASQYEHLGTTDPDAPIWVETMENGEYWFTGLQPGNYIVVQTQPDGLVDANDIVGTTTGFTFNTPSEAETAPASLLQTFSTDELQDAIVGIRVEAGGVSEANNFTEVRVLTVTPPPPPTPETINLPPVPQSPQVPGNPITPGAGVTGHPGLFGSQPSAFTSFIGTAGGAAFQTRAEPQPEAEPYTWHLSVVNGGLPRGTEDGAVDDVWLQAGYISNADWDQYDMDDAIWSFTETTDGEIERTSQSLRFGMIGGTPLAGDFDGDGTDEVAVFKDGYWMIDINRNGRWDDSDLLAKLGDAEDRPVVGDWDGDGKDDIGIYGPMWERDREAIERDPGLPNPDNNPFTKPKNVPPTDHDATNGARVMKLTSYGRQRADVVDHVFGVGEETEIPVTGDWNGNGIRSIGTFEGGTWKLDINGDGRFDHEDVTANFGRAGDIPLVGDFNGDGVEEIAVYRSGTWMIDTDGNRELTATDKTFEMGGAADKPVVGDWDGDGTDEPGLYTESQQEFN